MANSRTPTVRVYVRERGGKRNLGSVLEEL